VKSSRSICTSATSSSRSSSACCPGSSRSISRPSRSIVARSVLPDGGRSWNVGGSESSIDRHRVALEVVGGAEEHRGWAVARGEAAAPGGIERQVGERDAVHAGRVRHLQLDRLAHEHDVAGHEPECLLGSIRPQMGLARTDGVDRDARGPAGKRTPQAPGSAGEGR
jgi:hypothetical protein